MSNMLDQSLESYYSKRNPDSSDKKEMILKKVWTENWLLKELSCFRGRKKTQVQLPKASNFSCLVSK